MNSAVEAPNSALSAVLRGPGRVELERLELKRPGAGEILIEVAFSGICGSDLHAIRDPADLSTTVAKDAIRLGHEYSGIVRAAGRGVTNVSAGDAVACRPRSPCGDCQPCRLGDVVHCASFVRVRGGAWTEAIIVPQQFASRIPEGTTLRQAALTEPLACSLHAIDRSGLVAGERVLVIGGGPMGLLVALLAIRSGAASVFVSEPSAFRRRMAAELGAIALDPADGDVAKQVRDRTGGSGVEIAYEAAGLAATVEEAVASVGVSGRIVVVGVASSSAVARIRPSDVFARELTIMGAWGIETTFQRSLEQIGSLGVDPMITHEFPLSEVDRAIAAAASGRSGKVLLRPGTPRRNDRSKG